MLSRKVLCVVVGQHPCVHLLVIFYHARLLAINYRDAIVMLS